MIVKYTAVFEFEGEPPSVGRYDEWLGGKICTVSFHDDLERLAKLESAVRDLIAWCDKNPPAGESLYCVQALRDLIYD